MKLRKLLYPFSLLYGGITKTRNILYDKGILNSNEFDIPLIVVGNLRVGGTGKTPQVAYLIELLKPIYKVAVLSRGYKRKTSGFVLADATSDAKHIGDEPYQLFRRYPDIQIAVDADRTNGIKSLQNLVDQPDVIILDDAYQHRKVKAGYTILLTPYNDLYTEDTHLPSGNLRESIAGADRAQIIIVTKCPQELTEKQEYTTAVKLKPSLEQTIFFTRIKYATYIQNDIEQIAVEILKKHEIILITGIANPKPLLEYLNSLKISYIHLSYLDHHHFTESDIKDIQNKYDAISNKKKLLLTTEKDYVRIFGTALAKNELFYLAIETIFINHQKDFDKLILDYVGENTRDR
jgi:tetraacyldisaccharide 4'-kinase